MARVKTKTGDETRKKNGSIFGLLRPYVFAIVIIILLTVIANGLGLFVPKIIAHAIDTYASGNFVLHTMIWEFALISIAIFAFTYLQSVVQTYTSERVAKDLRTRLIAQVSMQDYAYVQRVGPAKLLTNLTSDVEAIKNFVSQAIASIISSIFLLIGASVLLLMINWKLALAVLLVVPAIGGTFYFVLVKVQKLFKKAQESIDALNKVINESILGAALVRLLNSQYSEYKKFLAANEDSKKIGLQILNLFASLIPIITFFTNLATLTILLLGGHFVISGGMTLGDFSAFNNYLFILIMPIFILGFSSNLIAQANASYGRIADVLTAPPQKDAGTVSDALRGDVEAKHVSLTLGGKSVLKEVSFRARAGTKTAIIGPTAAGKTQLLSILIGLIAPTSGVVEYDGRDIDLYSKKALHEQVGFVFQDSVMFNLSIRENIAFSNAVSDESLQKAIATAELADFIEGLPQKLDTLASERGVNLSGGQKQRIMLARALALNPRVLLLDDFTARVDTNTEQKIIANIERNYPGITLISVTQKIAPIENYDQIVLLMEGEVLAAGTHKELMETSPEYVQIHDSQQSTNNYELRT